MDTTILIPISIFAGLGILFGVILAVASRVFAVKTDERIERITEILPGANCGGCGYSGCGGYAEAVVKGEAAPNACRAGGTECAKHIGEIMGIAVTAQEPMVARVLCSGTCDVASNKCHYEGAKDCIAADRMHGGDRACPAGCLGLGTCVSVCPYDAIHIENGVAIVNEKKCVGCGACAGICPKKLIRIIPTNADYCVNCHSPETGAQTRKLCSVGCIGCKICEKNCPNDAIHINGSLASIDYSKCTNCGICAQKCPRKIIR